MSVHSSLVKDLFSCIVSGCSVAVSSCDRETEAWQHTGRCDAGEGGENSTSGARGSRKQEALGLVWVLEIPVGHFPQEDHTSPIRPHLLSLSK